MPPSVFDSCRAGARPTRCVPRDAGEAGVACRSRARRGSSASTHGAWGVGPAFTNPSTSNPGVI
jgi:hypothetical protein